MANVNLLPKGLEKQVQEDTKKSARKAVSLEELEKKTNAKIEQAKYQIKEKNTSKKVNKISAEKESASDLETKNSKEALKPQPSISQKAKALIEKLKRQAKPAFLSITEKLNLSKEKAKNTVKHSKGIDLDLLKEDVKMQRSLKSEIVKLSIIIGVTIFLIAGVFSFYYYQTVQAQEELNSIEEELINLDQTISSLKAQGASLQDSNDLIQSVYFLLKSRIDWLAFLKQIEELTLKQVFYTNLRAEGLQSVSLSGRAEQMEDAVLQMEIFKKATDFVQDFKTKSLELKEETVTVESAEQETIQLQEEKETYTSSFVEFAFNFKVNPKWAGYEEKKQEE